MEYKHQQFVVVTSPFTAEVGRTTQGHQPTRVEIYHGTVLMVDDMSGNKDNVSFILPSGEMGTVACGPDSMEKRIRPIDGHHITVSVFKGMLKLVDAYAQLNKWDSTSRDYLLGRVYKTLEGAFQDGL